MVVVPNLSLKLLHTESSCGWGGQEIRVLTEAQGMIQRGHSVHLVCPEASEIFHQAPRFSVPATPLAIGRKNPLGLWQLQRWLGAHPQDILISHSSTDSWLGALASRLVSPSPPIIRIRHISTQVPKNLPTRWLYAQGAARVVTTGERLRQRLIQENRLPPEHLVSIPTGIDLERFHPGDSTLARQQLDLPQDQTLLGIVATLRSWKGHLDLLTAFAAMNRPRTLLVMVGDGPMREPLEQRIREMKLEDRVRMVGRQENVEQWLRALDLFVLPSYANEGIPQALMQAMLSGIPVISTDVGAIGEIVQHDQTGWLVPPRDPMALQRAMTTLLDSPQTTHRLTQQALERGRERFGMERMLDAMEGLFHQVLRS